MENASKALLIAGAILIAILLIAIGMKVFNSASGVVDSAGSNMSSQEKTMYNKQWDMYKGTQSGSTCLQLLSDIASNNANKSNPGIAVTGLVTMNATDTQVPNGADTSIKRQAQYIITVSYDTNNGLVSSIAIANNAGGTASPATPAAP